MMKRIATASNRARAGIVLGVALILLCGCSAFHRGPTLVEPVGLIAVMPLEPVQPGSASASAANASVSAETADQVTGQLYAELRKDPDRRIVPDVIVSQAMRHLQPTGNLAARARALGKELQADAVLFGTVSRYIEREGTASDVRRPAAVGFALHLISVHSGRMLWNKSFTETQSSPADAHWLTAPELSRYGAEETLKDLEARLE
jgi:hypothetical protein